ncbi:AbrB/MazE/SpoVT family DNA-binding domain-containing protein [uncultured Sphingomonas sp.]|uniref:AbrB/MazE/SpoVT family DNA-binding domain-containing protein n=1 Tax=uncultured Sphingomonas sp. TaxID=158754 RepID=UPI0035CBDE3C
MSEEYHTKVFKSGNSLAVRLPKGLGAVEGTEMRVREVRGTFTFEPSNVQRKISGEGWIGQAPSLVVPPREDFDDPPRAWDDPEWPDFRK